MNVGSGAGALPSGDQMVVREVSVDILGAIVRQAEADSSVPGMVGCPTMLDIIEAYERVLPTKGIAVECDVTYYQALLELNLRPEKQWREKLSSFHDSVSFAVSSTPSIENIRPSDTSTAYKTKFPASFLSKPYSVDELRDAFIAWHQFSRNVMPTRIARRAIAARSKMFFEVHAVKRGIDALLINVKRQTACRMVLAAAGRFRFQSRVRWALNVFRSSIARRRDLAVRTRLVTDYCQSTVRRINFVTWKWHARSRQVAQRARQKQIFQSKQRVVWRSWVTAIHWRQHCRRINLIRSAHHWLNWAILRRSQVPVTPVYLVVVIQWILVSFGIDLSEMSVRSRLTLDIQIRWKPSFKTTITNLLRKLNRPIVTSRFRWWLAFLHNRRRQKKTVFEHLKRRRENFVRLAEVLQSSTRRKLLIVPFDAWLRVANYLICVRSIVPLYNHLRDRLSLQQFWHNWRHSFLAASACTRQRLIRSWVQWMAIFRQNMLVRNRIVRSDCFLARRRRHGALRQWTLVFSEILVDRNRQQIASAFAKRLRISIAMHCWQVSLRIFQMNIRDNSIASSHYRSQLVRSSWTLWLKTDDALREERKTLYIADEHRRVARLKRHVRFWIKIPMRKKHQLKIMKKASSFDSSSKYRRGLIALKNACQRSRSRVVSQKTRHFRRLKACFHRWMTIVRWSRSSNVVRRLHRSVCWVMFKRAAQFMQEKHRRTEVSVKDVCRHFQVRKILRLWVTAMTTALMLQELLCKSQLHRNKVILRQTWVIWNKISEKISSTLLKADGFIESRILQRLSRFWCIWVHENRRAIQRRSSCDFLSRHRRVRCKTKALTAWCTAIAERFMARQACDSLIELRMWRRRSYWFRLWFRLLVMQRIGSHHRQVSLQRTKQTFWRSWRLQTQDIVNRRRACSLLRAKVEYIMLRRCFRTIWAYAQTQRSHISRLIQIFKIYGLAQLGQGWSRWQSFVTRDRSLQLLSMRCLENRLRGCWNEWRGAIRNRKLRQEIILRSVLVCLRSRTVNRRNARQLHRRLEEIHDWRVMSSTLTVWRTLSRNFKAARDLYDNNCKRRCWNRLCCAQRYVMQASARRIALLRDFFEEWTRITTNIICLKRKLSQFRNYHRPLVKLFAAWVDCFHERRLFQVARKRYLRTYCNAWRHAFLDHKVMVYLSKQDALNAWKSFCVSCQQRRQIWSIGMKAKRRNRLLRAVRFLQLHSCLSRQRRMRSSSLRKVIYILIFRQWHESVQLLKTLPFRYHVHRSHVSFRTWLDWSRRMHRERQVRGSIEHRWRSRVLREAFLLWISLRGILSNDRRLVQTVSDATSHHLRFRTFRRWHKSVRERIREKDLENIVAIGTLRLRTVRGFCCLLGFYRVQARLRDLRDFIRVQRSRSIQFNSFGLWLSLSKLISKSKHISRAVGRFIKVKGLHQWKRQASFCIKVRSIELCARHWRQRIAFNAWLAMLRRHHSVEFLWNKLQFRRMQIKVTAWRQFVEQRRALHESMREMTTSVGQSSPWLVGLFQDRRDRPQQRMCRRWIECYKHSRALRRIVTALASRRNAHTAASFLMEWRVLHSHTSVLRQHHLHRRQNVFRACMRRWFHWAIVVRQQHSQGRKLANEHSRRKILRKRLASWRSNLVRMWTLTALGGQLAYHHRKIQMHVIFRNWLHQYLGICRLSKLHRLAIQHHCVRLEQRAFRALRSQAKYSVWRLNIMRQRVRELQLLQQTWCFKEWCGFVQDTRRLRCARGLMQLSILCQAELFHQWRLYVRRITTVRKQLSINA